MPSADPPLRILYVHHRREAGGAPASLAELIERLDRGRFEPHVYCPPGPAAERFRAAGATVHTGAVAAFTHIWASSYHGLRWLLAARELARLPAHVAGLERLLRSQRFALVHLNDSPLLPAALLARRRRIPVVWHLRSALPEQESARSRLLRSAVRRLAAASIAINADVAASFAAGSEVIPNGVNLRRFSPGEPSSPPTVVAVGFLYPWKGFREYLRAAALVRERGLEARLLLVGGGVREAAFFAAPPGRLLARLGLVRDHEAEARALVAELALEGTVELLPYTPDLVPLYRRASLVVSPSQGPELPRPLLEAAACGVPAAASGSRTGGGIVIPGETGLLVEPGSAKALADAIRELLADPERRVRMGAAARTHAEAAFDRDRNVRRIEALYDRVLGARKSARPETARDATATPGPDRGAGAPAAARPVTEMEPGTSPGASPD